LVLPPVGIVSSTRERASQASVADEDEDAAEPVVLSRSVCSVSGERLRKEPRTPSGVTPLDDGPAPSTASV
jgi:hypothetical protein